MPPAAAQLPPPWPPSSAATRAVNSWVKLLHPGHRQDSPSSPAWPAKSTAIGSRARWPWGATPRAFTRIWISRGVNWVPREPRHGMLCRACVEVRLGRRLAPAEFRSGEIDDGPAPEDQPMRPEDYGITDSLTPDIQAIDCVIIDFTLAKPCRVIKVVGHVMDSSLAAIPGLPDGFYFARVSELIDRGELQVLREGEDFRFGWVTVARTSIVLR